MGYEGGQNLQLVKEKTRGQLTNYALRCFRHRISRCDAHKKISPDNNGFSDHARQITVRRNKGKKERSHSYMTATSLPIKKEHVCHLRINVVADFGLDIYYIKSTSGNNTHVSHPPIDKDEIQARGAVADSETQELQTLMHSAMASIASSRRVIKEKTGLNFPRSFVERMSGKQLQEPLNYLQGTPAERLINFLRSQSDIKLVILYDDYTRSSSFTVPKAYKNPIIFCNMYDYDPVSEPTVHSACPSVVQKESMCKEADSLRKCMTVRGGKMVLAVGWTTKDCSRLFKIHPSVCSYDVTEGTNNEKRGFFDALNYGGDGDSNQHTNVFLPSQKKWVFNWISGNVIPLLHGKKACSKVEVNIFDQDPQEYESFEANDDIYPSASTIICFFHRVVQKLEPIRNHAKKHEKQLDVALHLILVFKHTMIVIADSIQTVEEYNLLVSCLSVLIDDSLRDGSVSNFVATELSSLLTKVHAIKKYFCKFNFRGKMNLFVKTTASNEVRHGTCSCTSTADK